MTPKTNFEFLVLGLTGMLPDPFFTLGSSSDVNFRNILRLISLEPSILSPAGPILAAGGVIGFRLGLSLLESVEWYSYSFALIEIDHHQTM